MSKIMTPRFFNTLGLALTIIGCVILFNYGLSADVDPNGRNYLIASDTNPAEIERGRHYIVMGKVGIGLIVVGSVLQIFGQWVPNTR